MEHGTPSPQPAPKAPRNWLAIFAAVLITAVVVTALNGGSDPAPAAAAAPASSVAPAPEPTQAPEPVEVETPDPVVVGETAACESMVSALAVPANSSRYNDRLLDAEDAAISDELYSELEDLYWVLSDSRSAQQLVELIDTYC